MAGIDKAAIGWSIAIVAAGVAIAFAGQSGQDLGVDVTVEPPEFVPTPQVIPEEPTPTDPFGDIAAEVKEQAEAPMAPEPVMEPEPEPVMEPEPEPVMEPEPEPVMEPEPEMAVEMGPKTVTVDMPAGTSVPGCEETNECYIPASVTVNVGDTVEWVNSDTAAHTVTSGSPANGPSGVFDSSLVMGGATYAFTFDEAGSYDYFCMVHPWMIGDVQVN